MAARSAYTKNLNRERVLEFEKEMLAKLATLADVERDIADVSQKRRSWLENISRADDTGLDTYIAKLNILRLRAQLSALYMSLDVTRLEGHYEAQTLNYLVAATQPLEDDETPDKRKSVLLQLQRQDNDKMLVFLEHSLQHRIQLGNTNYDLQAQLNILTNEVGLQQEAEEQEFREKVAFYTSRMQHAMEESQRHYRRITEEYLILRHNARVAKEVLTRSQNDAAQARAELQGCLDGILCEAGAQREKMEKNAVAELKFMTEDLRGEVIRKEQDLENATMRVKVLKSRQKKEVSTLKKELRLYNKKYATLQRKRRADIVAVTAELKLLRGAIGRVEQRLLEGAQTPRDQAVQGSPVSVGDNLDLDGGSSRGVMAKLRSKLRQLNH
jgi:hypothetical protein